MPLALDVQVANLTALVTPAATTLVNEVATIAAVTSLTTANQTNSSTNATTATGLATTAAANATISTAVAGLAGTAYSGVTAGNEVLAGVSKTFFTSSGIVASFIYDTKKDSDGGQWRKRCQHTSWYKESVFGRWLGEVANEAAARALTDATTGDFYHNTTDGLFYSLLATTGVVQVYRGNKREFPEIVAITAEAGRVIIWDLTDSSVPMWMVFVEGSWLNHPTVCTLAAINGTLYVGGNSTIGAGAYIPLEFVTDTLRYILMSTAYDLFIRGISRRNSSNPNQPEGNRGLIAIINRQVNSIAVTVLPNSPIDPATGLPVPTIAVGTAGGISVIRDDGSLVSLSDATYGNIRNIRFTPENRIILTGSYLGLADDNCNHIIDIPVTSATVAFQNILTSGNDQFFKNNSIPTQLQTINMGGMLGNSKITCGSNTLRIISSNTGLNLLKSSPALPNSSMVSYTTNTYNSGWMNGDIRLATCADTVVETVSGVQICTNGTNPTTTAGWVTVGCTLAIVGNEFEITATQTGVTYAYFVYSNPTAKSYVLTGSGYIKQAGGWAFLGISNGVYVGQTTSQTLVPIGVGQYNVSVAPSINIRLDATVIGQKAAFNFVSLIECASDRSVKANPMTVFGTLTKSPVATGSQLVAYSGFSSANYLQQPYNANLDFGTGDFCYTGWVKDITSIASIQGILSRWDGTYGIQINRSTSSGVTYVDSLNITITGVSGTLAYTTGISGTAFGVGVWHYVSVLRRSGVIEVWFDARLVISNSTVIGNISGTAPVLNMGGLNNVTYNELALSLWRASATAPSADQIAYIYETERKLFEPGAQCTIQGTSTAVTTLAYDDETDLLDVGTSWGRTTFKGLTVQGSEATTNGAAVSYNRVGNTLTQIGATGAKVITPSKLIRSELNRSGELKKAMNSDLVQVDFDAIAAQTVFVLPLGMSVQTVYSAGLTKRPGVSKDYNISNDGFRDTVTFSVAPGAGVWVSIMCLRGL